MGNVPERGWEEVRSGALKAQVTRSNRVGCARKLTALRQRIQRRPFAAHYHGRGILKEPASARGMLRPLFIGHHGWWHPAVHRQVTWAVMVPAQFTTGAVAHRVDSHLAIRQPNSTTAAPTAAAMTDVTTPPPSASTKPM